MSGDLNMGTNKISFTHVPTSDSDLINKQHFDALIALRLSEDDLRQIMNSLSLKASKSGDVLTDAIDMGNKKIPTSYVATSDSDLIHRRYLNL